MNLYLLSIIDHVSIDAENKKSHSTTDSDHKLVILEII